MDMGVWCWCLGDAVSSVYVCTVRCFPEHPGCSVLIRVWRMWVRVVSIPPVKVHLFYLQTRCSETLRIRTVILIGCSTILRWLVK